MVYVKTSIEIDATPKKVREVFLDWPAFPEWSTNNIKSIRSVDDKKPSDVVPGDRLKISFDGMKMGADVTDNSPQKFGWKGGWRGVLTGEHYFRFEPSETNPGGTTFYNEEEFHGFLGDLSKKTSEGPAFQIFNKNLKARVESLHRTGDNQSEGAESGKKEVGAATGQAGRAGRVDNAMQSVVVNSMFS